MSPLAQKAVLVYPKFPDNTFWSFSAALREYVPLTRFGTPKRNMPPLGLMGLAARLKDEYEEIDVFDRNVDNGLLEDRIRGRRTDVLIGGMRAQQPDFVECASIAKRAGKRVIAGGTEVGLDSPLMDI